MNIFRFKRSYILLIPLLSSHIQRNNMFKAPIKTFRNPLFELPVLYHDDQVYIDIILQFTMLITIHLTKIIYFFIIFLLMM